MERSEVENRLKWDLSSYAKSDDDFLDRINTLQQQATFISDYEGGLVKSVNGKKVPNEDKILELFDRLDEFMIAYAKIATYAHLRECENMTDFLANEMCEKVTSVSTQINMLASYIDVEISSLDCDTLNKLVKSEKFKNHKRYFEGIIREKSHMLSGSEEKLLSSLGSFLGGFSDSFDKFEDADLKFRKIKDKDGKSHAFNQSLYSVYAESDDRVLRRNAFKEINGRHGEYINFLATNYINDVKETCTFAKIRGYKSALSASIFHEEADEEVYRLLISKVSENIDIMERYFEIKRKILNLDQFAIYDSYAKITKNLSYKFTYDEAFDIIIDALSPLGKNYVDILKMARKQRWVDVMPTNNKATGAFSTGAYGANPVVLINFEGDIGSVFTLAHELGHALHTYHSEKAQPYETSPYEIFVAEVASTVNEMFLLNYFLKKSTSKEESLYFYDYFLKQVKSTIFRQTMFAEFEEKVHAMYENGENLTAEKLCNLYEKLNSKYHGKKCKQIPQMRYEWARIPHFYSSFYVYKYATGLISAIKIVDGILKGGKEAVENYLNFLSSGSKTNPVDILKLAGVDLTKADTFDEVFDYVNKMLSMMETL